MKLKLLFALIVGQFGFAQRTCHMEEKMEQMMKDPVFRQNYQETMAKFQLEYQKLLDKKSSNVVGKNVNATRVIPVAVHFPSVSNSSDAATKNCLRQLAQTQIDVINADYNASNIEIANGTWSAASVHYPGVSLGDLDVLFYIANQNHPAGTGLVNGDLAVTFGTDFLNGADSDSTWAGYMNFVVRDEGTSTLGYSPLAGSPSAGQTVVMNTFCFGTGSGCSGYVPDPNFNLGRTVTHELGHFFNLNHIFKSASASATNCGGQDADGVSDTPKQAAATYGCIAPGSKNACVSPNKVLSMNYMDYSDDPCMYMFTAGQATRALAYINTIYSQYNTNVLSTESMTKASFAIYPNPNRGDFSIQFENSINDYTLKVMDSSGRTVYEKEFYNQNALNQKIVLDNPSTGIYFVTIKTDKAVVTKKILIN